jgi:transposase-like protein
MSRRYTPQQKETALQRLAANFGNIAITSLQTGIPERTLRDWQQKRQLEQVQNPPLPPKISRRQQQPDTNEYQLLRDIIMEHLFQLVENLSLDPATAYLRAAALSRLIDRVIKLEKHIPSTSEQQKIVIEYFYDGAYHNQPPWRDDDDTG